MVLTLTNTDISVSVYIHTNIPVSENLFVKDCLVSYENAHSHTSWFLRPWKQIQNKSNDNDKDTWEENDKNIEYDCAQINSHAIRFLKTQLQRQQKTKKVRDIDKHIDLSGIVLIKVWSSRGKLNRKVLFIELRLNVYLGSVPNYWSHYNITMQWMMFQPPIWKFSSKQSSWKPL